MIYADRAEAGRMLARELAPLAGSPNLLVLGLPRGGVPVAAEIARALGAPLDVWVVRKLGAPGHEELAVGAIASGGVVDLDHELLRRLGVGEKDLQRILAREQAELERRERAFRGGRPAPQIADRFLIVVDDGLATGATMRAALLSLKRLGPARVVVAAPVASREACREFAALADACVCPAQPEVFWAVGQWYDDFAQVTDDEVLECLERAERARRTPAAARSDSAPPP